MQVKTYWIHNAAFGDERGIAWATASGPEGSIAIGGGGYSSRYPDSWPHRHLLAPEANFPIVASKPGDAPNSWLIGFAAPPPSLNPPNTEPQLYGIGAHVFVVVLEGL
jgi:hypothetical protein